MLILENKEEVEKGKEEVEEEKKESEENKEKEKGEGEVEENKKEEKGVEKGKEVQEKFIFTTYSNAIDFSLSFTTLENKATLEFKKFNKSSDNDIVSFVLPLHIKFLRFAPNINNNQDPPTNGERVQVNAAVPVTLAFKNKLAPLLIISLSMRSSVLPVAGM